MDPNKEFTFNIEGIDALAVAQKVKDTVLYILDNIKDKQDIGAFAVELNKEIETLFTPEERTYLTMMYCASSLLQIMKLNSGGIYGPGFGFPTDGPKPKTSPDETA